MDEPAITTTLESLSKSELTTVVCRLHEKRGFNTKTERHSDEQFVFYKRSNATETTTGLLWILGTEAPTPAHVDRLTALADSAGADQSDIVTTTDATNPRTDSAVSVLTSTALAHSIASLDTPADVFPPDVRPADTHQQSTPTTAHAARTPHSNDLWPTTTTNTTPPTEHRDYWDTTSTRETTSRNVTAYWKTTTHSQSKIKL